MQRANIQSSQTLFEWWRDRTIRASDLDRGRESCRRATQIVSRQSNHIGFYHRQSSTHVTPFSLNTVLAPHFSHQSKSHLLVDCNIRHHPRTFKVALPALLICPSHHSLHELLPYSLSLISRQHRHNVAEIVSLLVGPEFLLCFRLPCFPDPVPIYPQSATTEPADVEEALAEPQRPRINS
jgi:hypothetical protein